MSSPSVRSTDVFSHVQVFCSYSNEIDRPVRGQTVYTRRWPAVRGHVHGNSPLVCFLMYPASHVTWTSSNHQSVSAGDHNNTCSLRGLRPPSLAGTRRYLRRPNKPASINPYPTAFPYGNGMVLHFYQQQESSTTKTVHKVINKGLKTYV